MATDLNLEWTCAKDNVLIQNEQCLEQAITNALFFNQDEVYWGARNEIGLSRFNFELIGISGDMFTLRELAIAIKDFDRRLTLRESESSIVPVGDQWQLNLVIDYAYGPTVRINQLIERA